MKNIFEIMKEYGLEVPEDKKTDFEKSVLENYKTSKDYENQTEKLNQANETIKANDTAMKDLQTKLGEFKDADVTGLKDKVAELNKTIETLENDKKTIESDYQSKLSDRDFNDILKDSITSAKGKNAKAIAALLDVDALKASKNQKEDIAAAIKSLTEAEDSKMLFGEPEAKPLGQKVTLPGQVNVDGAQVETSTLRDALKEKYSK